MHALHRFAVILIVASLLPAQVEWRQVPTVHGRHGVALALDGARAIAFGGATGNAGVPSADTLGWTQHGWQHLRTPIHPSARSGHAMVFDAHDRVVVLFGGHDGRSRDDTWTWDGQAWSRLLTEHAPLPRHDHAMAFDALRGVVVLHGGTNDAGTVFSDTWTFDGIDWRPASPTNVPPGRSAHGLAFDAQRGVVLMFGGRCHSPFHWCSLGDTWEWNGTDWSACSTAQQPPPRWGHSLCYDPLHDCVLLFGGAIDPDRAVADTWAWDGQGWAPVGTPQTPPARQAHGCIFDRDHLLVFGGRDPGRAVGALGDTWALDGSGWTEVAAPSDPPWRVSAAMAYVPEARATLLFHGDPEHPGADTWLFDGRRWRRLDLPLEPSYRHSYALASDPLGGAILYGGENWRGARDETWRFDGASWTLLAPEHRPSARSGHSMVADLRRGRLVMFGGESWPQRFADTWIFDGDWQRLGSGHGPSARIDAAMAHDPRRDRVLLFGGTEARHLDDTWEFDGAAWQQLQPTHRPPPGAHDAVFDAARGCIVLHDAAGSTWEWNGSDWRERTTSNAPPAAREVELAWDPGRARTVLYSADHGTWTYGPSQPAAIVAFGDGCGGAQGAPRLTSATGYGPVVGGALELVATTLPPCPIIWLQLGLSREHLGSLPLPLALDPIGMPGCRLYVSCNLLTPCLVVGPFALAAIAVPADPNLVGRSLYVQAIAADPTANALGAITSNAVAARIGGR